MKERVIWCFNDPEQGLPTLITAYRQNMKCSRTVPQAHRGSAVNLLLSQPELHICIYHSVIAIYNRCPTCQNPEPDTTEATASQPTQQLDSGDDLACHMYCIHICYQKCSWSWHFTGGAPYYSINCNLWKCVCVYMYICAGKQIWLPDVLSKNSGPRLQRWLSG